MKKFILLFLLIPSLCFAVEPIDFSKSIAMSPAILGGSGGVAAVSVPCQGASPSDCLFRETFNGATSCGTGQVTTCDNTWVSVASWCDFDDGTLDSSTAAVCGGATESIRLPAHTAADEIYMAAKISSSAVAGTVMTISSASGVRATLTWQGGSTGKLQCTNSGGTPLIGTSVLSVDTRYWVKFRAKKGTGANAECQIWTSTNGTTWTNEGTSTNGTWTDQVDRESISGLTASVNTFDDIRVHTGDITW